MKAIYASKQGGPEFLEKGELPDPLPKPGEILLRVSAAALNPLDWKILRGHMKLIWRIRYPYVPAFDVAGTVVRAPGIPGAAEGERVFASTKAGGGLATLVCVPEKSLARTPDALSDDLAAAMPAAGATALQALRDGARLAPGARVLIHGASGGVGSFAVQIAKIFGANVTATASAKNLELVRDLGAQEVIDYAAEDFARRRGAFDVIFDVAGNRSFGACRAALAPGGIYITSLPGGISMMQSFASRVAPFAFGGKRCGFVIVKPNSRDLALLGLWAAEGKLRPVVERRVAFEAADVRDAFVQLESGHTRGKIVVRMNEA